jgi:hypothetical protein
MRTRTRTAGELVALDCGHRGLARALAGASVPTTSSPGSDGISPVDVQVTVESATAPFDTDGWQPLTRGAWHDGGRVVVRDACSSGLDLLVSARWPTLDVRARWRPPVTGRAASAVLRARAALLVRAVLLQYPALWWAQQRGRMPLHASVYQLAGAGGAAGATVLVAGPGGIGKSTLVDAEMARGAVATSDNLCVSDGRTAWGLFEPRRIADGSDGARGRRMPHGRREAPWPDRADELTPELVLVLRRGDGAAPTVTRCDPGLAARSLVAGTYMAGELRRYWAFAATLALGTGIGDVQPEVAGVARMLVAALPCLELTLGRPGVAVGAPLPRERAARAAR